MTVNVNLIVVCGVVGCPWSMEVDPDAGADAMTVQAAFLDHLDDHDLVDEGDCRECETAERWVNVAQALADECPSCRVHRGQPHTEYCRLPDWAAHDAEVARCLAEDKIPAAPPGGGFYNGQLYDGGLYAGDTPEQIAAEQARVDRFMAGGKD